VTTTTGVPAVEMAHAVASYQAMMFTLRKFDDTAARGPSLLPSWSRAHVVGHLARNADSHCRLLEAAVRGEIVPQYPGGDEGRAHEIELTSRQNAADLIDDFRRSSETLFGVWERMPDDLWDASTQKGEEPRSARDRVWARWRELEIHHADLDLGFSASDWPRGFVQTALPRFVAGLPKRRTGDAGRRPASWLLECAHDSGAWTVVVGSEATEVHVADESVNHDFAVRGPGWALLFWLLGRATLGDTDLIVTGDVEDAGALPLLHPYP